MFYCTQFKIAYAKELLSICVIIVISCERTCLFISLSRMTWETKESIDYIGMIRFIKDHWIWWHLRLLMKLRRKEFFSLGSFSIKIIFFVTAWMEKAEQKRVND